MTKPLIIGLVGHAGSGKDSCALALQPLGFRDIAFADAIRAEVAQAWGVDLRMLTDRATKEVPLPALAIGMCNEPRFLHWAMRCDHCLQTARSPRWVLQRWGSDYRREQDPDYWVCILRRQVGRKIGVGLHRIVITDVRTPNEAALVRDLGGRLVRVHRPDLPKMAADTANHSSEAHELLADAVIHNDASLDALQGEVERVLGELFGAEVSA